MPKVFVAMPFAQKFYSVYKAIREASEELGIQTIRIDEVWAREDIYKQIEEEILKADFVIADFTGDKMLEVANPNVVHEAAFARVNKKYIILMAQDHKCLPFDWRTRPAIIYQNNEQGLKYLKERLVIGIKALTKREDFGKDTQIEYYNQKANNYMDLSQYSYLQQTLSQQSRGQIQTASPFVSQGPVPGLPSSMPFSIMDNLIKSREGHAIPENKEEKELPTGFRKVDGNVICEMDESIMTYISPSSFHMGDEEDDDQQPIHEVKLSDYLIDISLVSNKQYQKFMESQGYNYQGFWSIEGWNWRCQNNIEEPLFWRKKGFNAPDKPVVGISWYEAMAYGVWAGKHLPTESQWEYAARGESGQVYPWGENVPDKSYANYSGKSTTICNSFPKGKSHCGCYDMAGNTWEWCYDWYSEMYYGQSPICNPIGPIEGEERVCRGGSWTYDMDTLKTYYRFFGEPDLRDKSYGFRCARIL